LRLPDFIIGGAPRSGTTWLALVADRHPAIQMAKPPVPEPKFFLRDDLFERGLTYYSETWFAGIPADVRAGEKSTNYLESATAAERIRRALPRVRLVFVLRNPVDRAYSNFLWSRQNGLETATFETALAEEEDRERELPEQLRYARPHALFSRGLYADLLRPYIERFPREQILVLRYEDIVSAPGDVASALHDFLGVAVRRADGEEQEPINAAVDSATTSVSATTRRLLDTRYAAPNRRLYELLGASFKPWPSLARESA
jgi:hypothetical protein